MTKKHDVKDAELEQVNGGGGVMDPPDQKLAEVEGNSSDGKFATHQGNLENDMILTETDRQ